MFGDQTLKNHVDEKKKRKNHVILNYCQSKQGAFMKTMIVEASSDMVSRP